jgi:hypothetical protein
MGLLINSYAPTKTPMKFIALLLLALSMQTASAQSYGSFIGNVVAKWNADGRTMTLTEPFAYLDPTGTRWDAPTGSTVDGASIPQFAWSIIGGPFEGNYRNSSVIHDVACVERRRPWELVHQAFYTGMLASGVSTVKAKVMYAAVYHFGPRWSVQQVRNFATSTSEQRSCVKVGFGEPFCIVIPATSQPVEGVIRIDVPPAPQTLTREAFDRLAADIESKESSQAPVSLDQIRDYK